MQAKIVIRFFFTMADRSQTSTGLSVHVYGGLQKRCLHCQQLVLLAKPIMQCSFNCQIPVISLGVSQQKHTNNKPANIFTQWSSKLIEKTKQEKTPLLQIILCDFRCLIKGFRPEVFKHLGLSQHLPLSQNIIQRDPFLTVERSNFYGG